ncbi:Hypothetical predicted protein [Mytilus galloprovincialis]|uniref:Fibronectin type-III domain-containing protein n=1 Tax=Mytilus galloprovincialis TaxID=29158 RepID=A0A8B6BDJ7_MYTGA|nr:Hypothetical predicted protein [Mytilus galloprovincialis]
MFSYNKHVRLRQSYLPFSCGCDSDHPVVSEDSVTSKSVALKWKEPLKKLGVTEVRFGPLMNTDDSTCTLIGLKSNTQYEFDVLHGGSDGHMRACYESTISITTLPSASSDIKKKSKQIIDGHPSIYKIPLEHDEHVGNLVDIRKYVHGQLNNENTVEKNILIFGPHGERESAVVDGIINYMFEISADDSFKFSVGHEFKKADTIQDLNTKECVNYYKVFPKVKCRVPYTVNIICAPTSVQSGNIEKFSEDLQKVGICFLNSIWFSTNDSILSTCGKNLGNYECVFNTSVDVTKPQFKESVGWHSISFQNCGSSSHVDNSNVSTCSNCLLFCMEQIGFQRVFDELKNSVDREVTIAVKVHLLQRNFDRKVREYEIAIIKAPKYETNVFYQISERQNSNLFSQFDLETVYVLQEGQPIDSTMCTYCKICNSLCSKHNDQRNNNELWDKNTKKCKACDCEKENHERGFFLTKEIPQSEKSALKTIKELGENIEKIYHELRDQSWLPSPQYGFSFCVIMLQYGNVANLEQEDSVHNVHRFSNLQSNEDRIAKLYESLNQQCKYKQIFFFPISQL